LGLGDLRLRGGSGHKRAYGERGQRRQCRAQRGPFRGDRGRLWLRSAVSDGVSREAFECHAFRYHSWATPVRVRGHGADAPQACDRYRLDLRLIKSAAKKFFGAGETPNPHF
jgi:hypothetical protein